MSTENQPLELDEFNSALNAVGAKALADQAILDRLVGAKGARKIRSAMRYAANGDEHAVAALKMYGTVAGFLAQLKRAGMGVVTYEQGYRTLKAHGVDCVRSMLTQVIHGNARARNQLSQWLCEAVDAASAAAPNGGKVPSAARPDGLTPAGRVERNHGDCRAPTLAGAPSLPPPHASGAAGSPQGNVRPFPVPAQDSREGPHAAPNSEPPYEAGDDALRPRVVALRQYDQAKAYGARAALTFSADRTRRDEPTVRIEAATGSNRDYNWEDKLAFQLTTSELELMVALLLHDLEEVHLSNHDDKWLNASWQTGQYAGTIKFTLGKGKATDFRPRTVQVDYSSHAPILGVHLRQCATGLKCRQIEVRSRVRTAASMYASAIQAKGQARGQATQASARAGTPRYG